MKRKKPPILVTGSHRSGTTFVGCVLAFARNIGYIHEPFNKDKGVKQIEHWFLYLKPGMKKELLYRKAIDEVLQKKAVYKRPPLPSINGSFPKYVGKVVFKSRFHFEYLRAIFNPWVERYLIKDPIACLSSEYLHREYDMDVVVLIRHPAAFVASLKRLNWRFDFNELLAQEELMREHLNCVLQNGYDLTRLSIAEEGAILWKCLYTVLFRYLDRNPKMVVVRHEDVSANPVHEFKKLFGQLGLEYTSDIEARIMKITSEKNPTNPSDDWGVSLRRNSKENIKRWKHILTESEIKTIKEITAKLADKYYSYSDW